MSLADDLLGLLGSLLPANGKSSSSGTALSSPCSSARPALPAPSPLPEPVVCCVCLEERPLRSRLLPCAHDQFCADCLLRWRAKADSCPLCRSEIREVAPLKGD